LLAPETVVYAARVDEKARQFLSIQGIGGKILQNGICGRLQPYLLKCHRRSLEVGLKATIHRETCQPRRPFVAVFV